jgi:hypothetical protein
MITVHLMDGLGNQLFMIFATLAYSIQHRVTPVFSQHNNTHRRTYWHTFFSDIRTLTENYPENPENFIVYQEPEFGYQPLPLFGEQSIKLKGYFQSFRYFEEVQSTLFEYIHLYDKQTAISAKYAHYLCGKETVAMHFRLGDYKQVQEFLPIMKYEYYENALAFILERLNVPNEIRVLYFCEEEDNDYVNQQIHKLQSVYSSIEFVKIADEIPDYEQLLIMSVCHHTIIANSTFSWWGAYFNPNPNKIVCYPSVWFGNALPNHSQKDMMLPEWNQIIDEKL